MFDGTVVDGFFESLLVSNISFSFRFWYFVQFLSVKEKSKRGVKVSDVKYYE